MHRPLIAAALLAALFAALAGPAAAFEVRSPAIGPDGTLPARYFGNLLGCSGLNISPEITWSGAPEGTASYVLTLFDEEAATPSGWWHWLVANIPADAARLPEAAGSQNGIGLPPGTVQVRGDTGMSSYQGPCPPEEGGRHRYVLTLYALGTPSLPLDRGASGAMMSFMAIRNALATATLTFTAERGAASAESLPAPVAQ